MIPKTRILILALIVLALIQVSCAGRHITTAQNTLRASIDAYEAYLLAVRELHNAGTITDAQFNAAVAVEAKAYAAIQHAGGALIIWQTAVEQGDPDLDIATKQNDLNLAMAEVNKFLAELAVYAAGGAK